MVRILVSSGRGLYSLRNLLQIYIFGVSPISGPSPLSLSSRVIYGFMSLPYGMFLVLSLRIGVFHVPPVSGLLVSQSPSPFPPFGGVSSYRLRKSKLPFTVLLLNSVVSYVLLFMRVS